MMDEHELFLTILCQKHLLKKISYDFSWKVLCNLSKAWRPFSEAVQSVNNKGTLNFFGDYVTNCILESGTNFEESKIQFDNYNPQKSFNFRNTDKITLEIFLTNQSLSPDALKLFGSKVNEVLETSQYLKKLTFLFSTPDTTLNGEHLIKKIKNDKISEIIIVIGSDFSDRSWASKFSLTSSEIFSGFTNLNKLKLYIQHLSLTTRDKKLIDAACKVRGITIEISLGRLSNNIFFPTHSSTNRICILTYVVTKKVYLSVNIPFFRSNLNINSWLRDLQIVDFTFIRSLRFHLLSPNQLQEFSKYLSYMKNLEWLGIIFNINYTCFQMENNTYMKKEKSFYESCKHLKKLKTLQISWYFNPSNMIIRKYMEGQLTKSENTFKRKFQTFERCIKIWQEEIFLFLSNAPNSVENLYFYSIPEFTCSITSSLNKFFPHLSFLFLGSIPKTEMECLKNFKNLKIFVSRCMDILQVPNTIESCMTCEVPYLLENVVKMKKYNDCCEYYRNLKYFQKEYNLHGSINGTIFFNYFHELYDIQCHFDDIYLMHKWYDKYEKGY